MNENHLTDEEIVDLYYDPSSLEMEPRRRHLQTCGMCRGRYDQATTALDLAKQVGDFFGRELPGAVMKSGSIVDFKKV